MHACHSSCLFPFLVPFAVLRLPRELNPGLVRLLRESNPGLVYVPRESNPSLVRLPRESNPGLVYVPRESNLGLVYVSCSMLMLKYYTFNFVVMPLTHVFFIKHKPFNMSFSQTICLTSIQLQQALNT
jgi:hypothetical protein